MDYYLDTDTLVYDAGANTVAFTYYTLSDLTPSTHTLAVNYELRQDKDQTDYDVAIITALNWLETQSGGV